MAKCPRLKTLRLEENCLALDAIPHLLLSESTVSTLNVNGNLFSEKQLADSPGFEKYMERYTAVRRKMDWILYYLNVLHRGIHPLDFSRQTTNSVHSGLIFFCWSEAIGISCVNHIYWR